MPDDVRSASHPGTRRTILWTIALAVFAGGAAWAVDEPIRAVIRSIRLGGDVKRELEMLQQFGGVASMVLIGAAIGLLQPWRFRRMLDWLLAAGLWWVALSVIKVASGRLRPRIEHEGSSWIGPLGHFAPEPGAPMVRPIEFWRSGVYESLSMPSTHTSHAAIAAAFLIGLYPRLRWMLVPWVVVVGFGRVFVGAHWPSDVVVGGILGWGLGTIACRGSWGVRLVDWVWVTCVDRNARPALWRLEAEERDHGYPSPVGEDADILSPKGRGGGMGSRSS